MGLFSSIFSRGKKSQRAQSLPSIPTLPPEKIRTIVYEIVSVSDPLTGAGVLSTQFSGATAEISVAEISDIVTRLANSDFGLMNVDRFDKALLPDNEPERGYAGKEQVGSRVATILFGEVEAVSRSAAKIHPEIIAAMERIDRTKEALQLLAIDGLVYACVTYRVEI